MNGFHERKPSSPSIAAGTAWREQRYVIDDKRCGPMPRDERTRSKDGSLRNHSALDVGKPQSCEWMKLRGCHAAYSGKADASPPDRHTRRIAAFVVNHFHAMEARGEHRSRHPSTRAAKQSVCDRAAHQKRVSWPGVGCRLFCGNHERHSGCPSSSRDSRMEAAMKRSIALVLGLCAMGNAHRAFAQDAAPGPGTVEATVMPGGAMFFTRRNGASGFGDYTLGGAVTYNISRVIGLEGQVSGSIGISNRSLRLAGRGNLPGLPGGASPPPPPPS